MSISKRLFMSMAWIALVSGCTQQDLADEAVSIFQKTIIPTSDGNNQILQSAVKTNRVNRHMRGLKQTGTNPNNGAQIWSLVAETDNSSVQATLYFATSWGWTGKNVQSLSTSNGLLTVTYFNSGSGGATTTVTMNSGNPSGDSLVIKVPANAAFNNITWIKFSSYQVASSYGLYKGVWSASANTPASSGGDGILISENVNQGPGCSGSCYTVTEDYMIPVGGYKWNQTTGAQIADASFISFGANNDAIGGCPTWGIAPWGANSALYKSCIRAKRADLCGDGRPWTVGHDQPPQLVYYFDFTGCAPVQQCDRFGQCTQAVPPECTTYLEGWYTDAGASCFNPQNWRGGSPDQVIDPNGNNFNAATSCGRIIPTNCSGSIYALGIGFLGAY